MKSEAFGSREETGAAGGDFLRPLAMRRDAQRKVSLTWRAFRAAGRKRSFPACWRPCLIDLLIKRFYKGRETRKNVKINRQYRQMIKRKIV